MDKLINSMGLTKLAGWGILRFFTTEDIYCIDFGPARKNKNMMFVLTTLISGKMFRLAIH